MESRHVKLTMPIKLYEDSKLLAKENGYSNIQDLALESLRRQIAELKKIADLRKLLGSAKPRPRLTKEEKEKIAREHTPEEARRLTKEFGFEDIRI